MNDKQHQEDTKYKQWQDGMYVMLDDLADPLDERGYVLALVEDSLRDSVYFRGEFFHDVCSSTVCYGVRSGFAGVWTASNGEHLKTELTREQALYIATGDTDI